MKMEGEKGRGRVEGKERPWDVVGQKKGWDKEHNKIYVFFLS